MSPSTQLAADWHVFVATLAPVREALSALTAHDHASPDLREAAQLLDVLISRLQAMIGPVN